MQVGWAGYLNTNEKYFYCLDALPIFIAFCIYSLLPFGKYLDAPLALRLPTSAKEVIVTDSSSSMRGSKDKKSNSSLSTLSISPVADITATADAPLSTLV